MKLLPSPNAKHAIPAMQWACSSGMVQGMNDPNGEGVIFAPESKGIRAQIATMMMRFCEEIMKKVEVNANKNALEVYSNAFLC